MGIKDILNVKPADDFTLQLVQPPAMPGGYTPQSVASAMRMRSDAPGIEPSPSYVKTPKPTTAAKPDPEATTGDMLPSKGPDGELRYSKGDINSLRDTQNKERRRGSASTPAADLLGA